MIVEEELKDAPEESETQQQEKPVFSPHEDTFCEANVEADEGKTQVHYLTDDREHGGTTSNLADVQRDDEENQEYSLGKIRL